MSRAFFDDLGIPRPDIDLGVGSGSHAEQTGRVMMAFEKVCLQHEPNLVLVVGDVNSTMACTITAKKLGIPVAHVEAGLRSRDMTMPEEINRLCTDVLCDYLFTTDVGASTNLAAEGIAAERIVFVGNVMIDTLERHREAASALPILRELGIERGRFATLTLHRPSNVDDEAVLRGVLQAVAEIARELPIVFPAHPRTRERIERFGLQGLVSTTDDGRGVKFVEPLGYLEFLRLVMDSRFVLTDSGGLQEETTVLGVPCITLRFNTERPITCEQGTNVLVGNRPESILEAARGVLAQAGKPHGVPDKWDGRAAERIVTCLEDRIRRD